MKGFNPVILLGPVLTAAAWLLVTWVLGKYPDAVPAPYSWESWMFWGGDWMHPANLLILKKVLMFSLGVQILGVIIMTILPGRMLGLLVAFAGSFIAWPLGMICIEGYLRAHNKDKYRCLEQFHPQKEEGDEPVPGPFSRLYTTPLLGLALLAMGIGFIYLDGINCATLMFVCFGVALLIRSTLLRKQLVALLYNNFITAKLNVWSPQYDIPFSVVTDYSVDHRNVHLSLNVDGQTVMVKIPVRCMASAFETDFRDHCKYRLAQLLPDKAAKADRTN